MDLHGKRVLITHTFISKLMGSTLVCAHVAEAFTQMGADVLVLAASFAEPARAAFERRNIKVTTDENQDLDIHDFDYVWIHSQLLPIQFVNQLQAISDGEDHSGKPLPVMIYNHMSAWEEAPDEHPYIPALEENTASLELFVSEKTKQKLSPYYSDANKDVPQRVFANPVPAEFMELTSRTHPSTPKNICIISNHVPGDLMEAVEILRGKGLTCDIIGEQWKVEEVTAATLERYDAVITIGKTVQYCLCTDTPVYVYDYFGGPGYLSASNIALCSRRNYSGKGFTQKEATTIAEEIVNGYADACAFQDAHVEEWRQQYNIHNALTRVLEGIKPRKDITFPFSGYRYALASQMRFAWRFYRALDYEIWVNGYKARLEDERNRLNQDLDHTREERDHLHRELMDRDGTIANLQHDIQNVYRSHSYRLGNLVVKPIHNIVHVLRRKK